MSLGGADIELRAGTLRATVTEIGGGMRSLRDAGRDLVLDYPAGTVRPKYAGALLAPWPNRLADGRYAFDDETHQLPLTEPERLNALHGLVCWDRFAVRSRADDRVTLGDTIVPRDGYPFEVDVEVAYVLDEDGLTTRVTASNAGRRPAPWGTGPHPYLVAGDGPVDAWELALDADEVLEVTPDRLLPTGPAAGREHTPRLPRRPAGGRRRGGPRVHRAGPRRRRARPGHRTRRRRHGCRLLVGP